MSRQTFTATFRGEAVRNLGSNSVFSTTSIYPSMYAVLTYPMVNGQPAFTPKVVATYQTVKSCTKEIRDREVLRSYPGQSFIAVFKPGCTEIIDAEIVEA